MLSSQRQKQKYLIPNKFSNQRPKTYFDLISKVGSNGKYQTHLMLIFFIIWAQAGAFVLNFHMFFLSERFTCLQLGLIVKQCRRHVCQLPRQFWDDFIQQQARISTSIVMQFGPYYCSDNIYLKISKYVSYFGAFMSILIFSYVGDNIGRRKALIFSLLQFFIGALLLSMSTNLPMATVAFFFCIGGSISSSIFTFPFLNQIFLNEKRQKYSVLMLIIFSLFGFLGTIFLYLIPNWRIFSIIFLSILGAFSLFFSWLYIQETPLFLLKRQNERSLKCLNRIGKINYKIQQILQQEDIISVKIYMQNTQNFNSLKIHIFSILQFHSVKVTFICCIFFGIAIFSQFYLPAAILAEQNQNQIYLITFLIRFNQLSVFIPVYFFIQEIKRKKIALLVLTLSCIISLILLFLKRPSGNLKQVQTILQIIFVFIHRSLISVVVSYFYMYMTELFPLKMNAHILGFSTVFAPLTILFLQNMAGYHPTIFPLIAIICIVSLALILKLKTTKNNELKYEVQQIVQIKEAQRQEQPFTTSFKRSSLVKSLVQDKIKRSDIQFIKSQVIE